MIVDNPHCIDFDNQRLYVFTQYVSSSDMSHYYLNYVTPNSQDQKFVGVFEEDHLPDAPEESDTDGDGEVEIPSTCPICGGTTAINKDNESEVLICTNPNCSGKTLAKFVHFAPISNKCSLVHI